MHARLLFATFLLVAGSGCSGDDGANGAEGAKGTNGNNGSNGADGTKGSTGDNGTTGSNGSNGSNGADGSNGSNGSNGADGLNGSDGDNVILSETASTGLKLSEVTLNLDGLGADAIESVGRGSYLVNAVGDCKGCHGSPDGKFLAGNSEFSIGSFDPNDPLVDCNVASPPAGCTDGHVYARNLTPDTVTGLQLTETQFIEALRRGTDFQDPTGGSTMLVMPWAQLRWLTTQDLRDIYHYLQTIPAVSNAVQADVKPIFAPPPSPFYDAAPGDPNDLVSFADTDAAGFVARPLPTAFDPGAGIPTVEAGATFDTDNVLRGLAISPVRDDDVVADLGAEEQQLYGRGSYIVNGPGLCNECHTPGGRDRTTNKVKSGVFLTGGQAFSVPPPLQPLLGQVRTIGSNLTGADNGFKLGLPGFLQTLLSGMSFSGGAPHQLGFPMPFDVFRDMSSRDKLAVFTYISTIQRNAAAVGIAADDAAHQAPSRYCTTATQAADCKGAGETCDATTKTCVGGGCDVDADCGACQTCDSSNKCVAEDPDSLCVKTSL